MGNYIAILGTDTDVGKTTVTAGLVKAIHSLDIRASVIKPVQTGCRVDAKGCLIAPDIEVVREACSDASVFSFSLLREPCSPHLAGAIENKKLCVSDIIASFKEWEKCNSYDLTLVEFAGGLMVPLNNKETQADLLKNFPMPVLLVVPNKLGVINHALLTLRALRELEIDILGIIFSMPQEPMVSDLEKKIQEDNKQTIALMGDILCKGDIPFLPLLSSRKSEERAEAWNVVAESLLPAATFLVEKVVYKISM